ncbi:hypothetical protein P154DRAFT_614231 [Amniculicola lignicola CBS 123094]|uniref:F-box domain-containing protein n=1 Tax=Amniculicola lignicola CBS 123094 TaxID=1392246 RepID=A0A6A5X4H4_9PLEO|nr:hypothetical protein P154DRAFT_614231 [Amniculicola lignicola CBS 123094]
MNIDREVGIMRKEGATLGDLPDELLVMVVDFVPFNLSDRSVWCLSLMNKRLHRLCLPKLYHRYSPELGNPAKFLSSIMSDEGLARKVKDVFWAVTHTYSLVDDDQANQDARKALLAAKLPDDKGPFAMKLASMIESGGCIEHCLLTAVLMYTPNLECLSIMDVSFLQTSPLLWLDPIKYGIPHNFQYLRSFEFRSMRSGSVTLTDLEPLFSVSSLRKLTLEGITGDLGGSSLEAPARLSNIDHVYFDECSCGFIAMGRMMMFLRALKTFEDHSKVEEVYFGMDYGGLCNTLSVQKNSLETISIDYLPPRNELEDPPKLGSFCEFEFLRTLQAPLEALHIPGESPSKILDLLPPSLQVLQLSVTFTHLGCDRYYTSVLESLATQGKSRLPKLELVELLYWVDNRTDEDFNREKFYDLFDSTGIKAVYLEEEYP